jgi:hypothetical protein
MVGYDPVGEAEHVGALRVLGTTLAFVGRQRAVRVDLALAALQELFRAGLVRALRSTVRLHKISAALSAG